MIPLYIIPAIADGIGVSEIIAGKFVEQMRRHEGLERVGYYCPKKVPTAGLGHTGPDVAVGTEYTITQCWEWFIPDCLDAFTDVRAIYPFWREMSPIRRCALINMAYNIGRSSLAGFPKMNAAIAAKDWRKARSECHDSDYADDVGYRCDEIAAQLYHDRFCHLVPQ